MKVTWYRPLWWATVLAVAVPASVLGLLRSPIPAVVVIATAAGVVLGLAFVYADPSWRRWVETVAGALALAPAAPVLGSATLPILVLASTTSTPVVSGLLTGSGRRAADDVAGVGDPTDDVSTCLAAMSGAELCELWGEGFTLVRSQTSADRAVGAGLRRTVLDELERRDGNRLADWLARHPCPASRPRWAAGLPRASDGVLDDSDAG